MRKLSLCIPNETRITLSRLLSVSFVLGCFLFLPSLGNAQQPRRTPPRGRHFILMIDDSGSIKEWHRSEMLNTLPDLLFKGKGIPATDGGQAFEGFDPSRDDRLTIVFFTILGNIAGCTDRALNSADPDQLFEVVSGDGVKTPAQLAGRLRNLFAPGCRFNGDLSPIAISQLLILPYLEKKHFSPGDESSYQTILIVASDGEYNASSPSHELITFKKRENPVRDTEKAGRELDRASRLFEWYTPQGWLLQRGGVYYLCSELRPRHLPETAVQYQREARLDPQAISTNRLRYALGNQPLGDIQLSRKSPYGFEPLWLYQQLDDGKGGAWRIGDATLPKDAPPLDLVDCQAPQCERTEYMIGVSLFNAAVGGGGLAIAPSEPDPGPGRIKFQVGFRYKTDVYSHLYALTPWLEIESKPVEPARIPNPLFLPDTKLDKGDLTSEWSPKGADNDGVTTQEEARYRILAKRNLRWVLLVILAVLVMVFLFLRYFRRRFLPRLKWLPETEVVVDFDRPAASRLLAGTLEVENNQPVPWLGRLFNNEEQPTSQAEISLNYNYFQQSGLDIAGDHPIGFVRTRRRDLDRTTREAVSDSKRVHVFLAAEMIRDYQANGVDGQPRNADVQDAPFDIPLVAEMHWGVQSAAGSASVVHRVQRLLRTYVMGERPGSVVEKINCHLVVKPEEPRRPRVTYEPSNGAELYFEKDAWVQIGSFHFESKALHRFAQPYRWDGYTIQTYQGHRQLSGEPIRLAQPGVEVPSWDTVEIPVYIYCDGQTIPNPDPVSCEYSFKLIGDFDAESEPGPYTTTLYRDPKRAEIELQIVQPKRGLEVYWTPNGTTKLRALPDGVDANELLDHHGVIVLAPQTIKFDANNTRVRDLLSFEIGNSCKSGRGVVEVDLTTSIRCDQAVRNSIRMDGGRPLDDLLGVYDFKAPKPRTVVKEGESSQTRAVRLHPSYISHIVPARIETDRIAAEVKLDIRIVDDQGAKTPRALTVVVPLSLEQLPGLNWLAIDFGTSAISAALGMGRANDVMMVPLQDVTVSGGRSFAQYDTENPERGNSHLLPSWICCNTDLRDESGDRSRPGFPGYYSENLSRTPGEPDFIGLPAVTHDFEEHAGRIIYSLKSWLGTASRNIPIQIKKNGKEVQEMLPLEKMVESGFAALAEAYLFEPDYRADQIVISHPNTFTRRHQDLLHRIAHSSLGKPRIAHKTDEMPTRFHLPLKERIRLISESDAVAYYYCTEQERKRPRGGTETILVYDFGAGTLDLSLIKVVWKKDPPRYPLEWKVEKRLGVPVAGNYIDEILARLIHRLLSDRKPNRDIVNSQGFEYRFPVVGRSLDKENKFEHQRAIIRLWNWIREAKHEWSKGCREALANGGGLADYPPFKVKVGIGKEMEVVRYTREQERPNAEEPTDKPGLWVAEGGYTYLSIPARLIHRDDRMLKFIEFVTKEVIDELIDAADAPGGHKAVNTVIVSGRGALYPGLRERVWGQFPDSAEKPDLLADDAMKSAVVLGAIARQSLSREFTDTSDEAALTPKLGVLINHDDDLVLEEDWDKPIDLTPSPTFRLVQVNLENPNPREDMKSLRKHFYIDLADPYFRRDDILGGDKNLYVRKEIRNGELAIYLEGEDGENRTPIFTEAQVAKTVTTPPWPVGNVLLDPQG